MRNLLLFFLSFIILVVFMTQFREKDVYDIMAENEQKEIERRQNMTQEQRDAEDQAKKQEEEKKQEELKVRKEREDWELKNTDEIHYTVNRYSEDGKFVVPGKYTLSPASSGKLEIYNLENRGFNQELDNEILVVDTSFFDGFPPKSKFDIYYVVWTKGSRDETVRVGISHRDISRGW